MSVTLIDSEGKVANERLHLRSLRIQHLRRSFLEPGPHGYRKSEKLRDGSISKCHTNVAISTVCELECHVNRHMSSHLSRAHHLSSFVVLPRGTCLCKLLRFEIILLESINVYSDFEHTAGAGRQYIAEMSSDRDSMRLLIFERSENPEFGSVCIDFFSSYSAA